ncbi:MAG: helix-turn-helix transcriptional regulator [Geopsychrobacter sp.]|nr:helix-turn-helix transcriptional regulator [Geopsychrobacter sp.]
MRNLNVNTAPIASLLKAMGQRLDALRIKQGIKNEDLATKSGVNRNTLTRLWQGKPVSSENLFRVLRALGAINLITAAVLEPPPSPIDLLDAPQSKKSGKAKTKVYSSRSKSVKIENGPRDPSTEGAKTGLVKADREAIQRRFQKKKLSLNQDQEKSH